MLAKMSKRQQHQHQGVGLVEVMVALAILGVLLGVAWPNLADMLARYRVEAVAAELRANLAYARSEAGLRSMELEFWFNRDLKQSCYTLSAAKGPGMDCVCTRPAGTACVSGPLVQLIESKTVQVSRMTGVELKPQAGDRLKFVGAQMPPVPPNFSVLVQSSRVGQLQISMNPLGRISMCTPDQSMPGVSPCQ
ncbi:pilus assembly FimT family protein [Paucibacter soli]|uniref:pilus assembly FimT family protein n=1 Tax=Paucibacter soli TaxID=3133433 RepID=UPI0030B4D2BA